MKDQDLSENSDSNESNEVRDDGSRGDSPPVPARPMLFKIALTLLIGWMLFLAYVAYRVLAT